MKEAFWAIRKATIQIPCEKDPAHTINSGEIYFKIEDEKGFLNICIDCFINYCDKKVAELKNKILDWDNIKGKCLMRREK
jgi:hypothetical protein